METVGWTVAAATHRMDIGAKETGSGAEVLVHSAAQTVRGRVTGGTATLEAALVSGGGVEVVADRAAETYGNVGASLTWPCTRRAIPTGEVVPLNTDHTINIAGAQLAARNGSQTT